MPLTGEQPPLLIILGATAVGKTGLAIDVAERLNGEIIGADSRQIYKYMDIGTAKPTPEQQARVVHYLVDMLEPDEKLSVADFQQQAYRLTEAIHARGKLPMLVGGTGQYITAVEEGWSIPHVEPNDALRADLEAEAARHGNEALHERLQAVDPDSAAKIHPNNVRRVVRALEVYLEAGTPISVLQQKRPPPYRIRTIGLTMPRADLHRRADLRFDLMMEQGFLEEVQSLLDRGYSPSLPAMSALGYRELAAALRGESSLEEAIERSKISTHQFIRQQELWFRGHDNGILWHNMNDIDPAAFSQEIANWLRGE